MDKDNRMRAVGGRNIGFSQSRCVIQRTRRIQAKRCKQLVAVRASTVSILDLVPL